MTELEVLALTASRLDALGLAYMLTGSFALAYYATPRMTRDIDLVLEIEAGSVDALADSLSPDFYIDADSARQAIAHERLFNLMHYGSGLKIDLIVRKSSTYRRLEFDRRQRVLMGNAPIWIVSRAHLGRRSTVGGHAGMSDTSPEFQKMVDDRYRAMSADERVRLCSQMYDTARQIVESSLPPGLTREERRLAIARRFYAGELPEKALLAYAFHGGDAI